MAGYIIQPINAEGKPMTAQSDASYQKACAKASELLEAGAVKVYVASIVTTMVKVSK